MADAHSSLLDREPRGEEVSCWYPEEVESSINVEVLIASTPEHAELNG